MSFENWKIFFGTTIRNVCRQKDVISIVTTSIQVTTLEVQHNHEPMLEDDNGGRILGSAKKVKSPPAVEEMAPIQANGEFKGGKVCGGE